MQIVIDIPEEYYSFIKNHQYMDRYYVTSETSKIFCAIKHGTPLPKGHGRIIDEGQITQVSYHEYIIKVSGWQIPHCFIDGTDAPTIIEADTESEG